MIFFAAGPDTLGFVRRAPAVHANARPFGFVRGAIVAGVLTVFTGITGCGEADHQPDSDGPGIEVPAEASAWRAVDGSTVLALPPDDPALQALTAMPVEELARTRDRFLADEDNDDATWFVLWATESSASGREFLWLQVAGWTEFRIEGFIASSPIAPADSSIVLGRFRGVAPDEVIDWMRVTADSTQGGQAIGLLERDHGRARDALPGTDTGDPARVSDPDDR